MSTIVSIRRVANNGLQGELTDKVNLTGRMNVLQRLNMGDSRFDTTKPRHAWFPVTMLALTEIGFSDESLKKIEALKEGEKFECNFERPTIDGEELAIQINETVIPDQYQYQNVTKAAKQLKISESVAKNRALTDKYDLSKYVGQTGYFVDADGNYIFSRAVVTIKSQVQHNLIENARFVPETEMGDYGVTLHEPISVEEFTEAKQ